MSTPLQAMLWELWRTSWVQLAARVVLLAGWIALLRSATRDEGEPTADVLRGLAVIFSIAASIFSPTWIRDFENEQIGFPFQLGFVRPITTARLVAIPMFYAITAAVLCYCVQALLFGLPLAGPSAIIASAVAGVLAISWSTTTRGTRAAGLAVWLLVIIISSVVFQTQRNDPTPFVFAMGKPEYFAFQRHHYLALATVTATMFVVTRISVERQRHGERWQLAGLLRRAGKSPGQVRSLKTARPFAGRLHAQCWYEMRRLGPVVLTLGAIAPLLVLVFVTVGPWVVNRQGESTVVWLVALGFFPLVYQLVGTEAVIGLRNKQGATQLSAFDATRSMPSDQMIAGKLIAITACSLVGWLGMGLAAVLHAVAVGELHVWARYSETVSTVVGDVSVYWWVVGLSNAVLLFISTSSIMLAFVLWIPLHPRIYFGGVFLLLLHGMLAVWDAEQDWSLRAFWVAYGYVLSIAIIGGSLFALKRALAAGILGKRLFGCACCLWVVYVTSTIALHSKATLTTEIPPAAVALGVAFLLVPLAATAIAPLALDAHRHA